jgi:ribosomal protein S19E (S16A)
MNSQELACLRTLSFCRSKVGIYMTESAALAKLKAAGWVGQTKKGNYLITPAGRVALQDHDKELP